VDSPHECHFSRLAKTTSARDLNLPIRLGLLEPYLTLSRQDERMVEGDARGEPSSTTRCRQKNGVLDMSERRGVKPTHVVNKKRCL